jgi:ferredoxin-like protein FixX
LKKLIKTKISLVVDQSATNNAENPDVNKVQIMITPADKVDSNKPIKLQLSIHACFELSKIICRKPQFKWPY